MTGLVLLWTVSAFCCSGVGGGYCGATASGALVRPGAVAAPASLAFGTQLSIPGYSDYATVLDRGGAIGEGRLDVWFADCRDAWAWGVRRVPVTVLGEVSPEAIWQELLEDFTYLDEGVPVRKQVWLSNRGIVETFEVLR